MLRPAVAVLLLVLAVPGRAQPAPPPASPAAPAPEAQVPETPAQARCRRLLPPRLEPRPGVEALDDGGCRFTHVRIGDSIVGRSAFGPAFRGYEAETVTEHGIPADQPDHWDLLPAGPVAVQVEARNVVLVFHTDSPQVNWQLEQQQFPFDVTLDAALDPATHELTLRRLSVDGVTVGHVSLSAVVSGVTGSDLFAGAGLRSVQMHLDSYRFLLVFVLPNLTRGLPSDDPGAAAERARARVIAAFRTFLPLAHASAATVDAAVAFARDFARPRHVLDVSVTADPPVPFDAILGLLDRSTDVPSLLGTLTATATYAGEPH